MADRPCSSAIPYRVRISCRIVCILPEGKMKGYLGGSHAPGLEMAYMGSEHILLSRLSHKVLYQYKNWGMQNL